MERKTRQPSLVLVLAAFLFLFLIPAICILISGLIDGLFQWTSIYLEPFALRTLIFIPLLLIGSCPAIASNIYLYRTGKGYPWGDARVSDETRTLVTKGPYRYTRNPMILGYALILSSLGILIDSITMSLVIPSLFLMLLSAWIKLREEPALRRRFRKTYLDYKRNVPFLIPRPQKKTD